MGRGDGKAKKIVGDKSAGQQKLQREEEDASPWEGREETNEEKEGRILFGNEFDGEISFEAFALSVC